MIVLTERQKETIRELVKSARGHGKNAQAIADEIEEICLEYYTKRK